MIKNDQNEWAIRFQACYLLLNTSFLRWRDKHPLDNLITLEIHIS